MKKQLAVQSIHSNGTSKKSLLEDLGDACSAIYTAMEKLSQTSPHMRDFYCQPTSQANFDLAQAQHWERMAKLRTVRDELMKLGEAIADGGFKP